MRVRACIVLVAAFVAMAFPLSTAVRAQSASYTVAPGDVLSIAIYAGGDKQDEFELEVQSSGIVACPMAGELKLEGLTVAEIAWRIREILARDYYVDPEVITSIKQYGGRVYVLGEVKNAGVYSLQVAPTALSACVLAGGFTDFAAPRHGRITRLQEGKPRVIEIDLVKVRQGRSRDMTLMPGDRIEVPRRRF
jgi:protein involved in polysaccharide export with SLBB domain